MKYFECFVIIFLNFQIIANTAYGYLDPGSGSYVLQVLIAGLLSSLYFIKTFWGKIKAFFQNLFNKDKNEQ
jgi:hypothetical protein